jgi:hypothetical protein
VVAGENAIGEIRAPLGEPADSAACRQRASDLLRELLARDEAGQ